jgi:hypothetical protein
MGDLKYIVKFDDGSHIMTNSIFDYAVLNGIGDSLSIGKILFKVWVIISIFIILFSLFCALLN